MYYRLDGDTIIEMKKVANDGSGTTERYVMAYDENGNPFSISYYSSLTDSTPDTYYYVLNLQGDVLQLRDSSNNVVCIYTYDAWGKVLSVTNASGTAITDSRHIANVNPFRYRGYYYDVEIGFYYCNSRYYDPEIGRFINADDEAVVSATPGAFTDKNLYAYCDNNPVVRVDNGGYFWETVFDVISLALSVADVVKNPSDPMAWVGLAADAVDLVPVVTGVGETVRAVNTTKKAVKVVTEVPQAVKVADNTVDIVDNVTDTSKVLDGACFVSGTYVLYEKGYVPIEVVSIGDVVFAWNETTDEVELKRVVETYVNETDELVHLYVNGEKISTTPSHPFYSPVKGWTDAVNLRAGDILVLVNGEYVVLEKVQHEILESPITVYNFQVEDDHTYYVGESGVLVHNACVAIEAQRQSAVRKAWQIEADNVRAGISTYPWSQSQIDELLTRGKISGYQGHHVISVKANPALAGDPSNILFVTRSEHLYQHFGNWRNPTYGLRP